MTNEMFRPASSCAAEFHTFICRKKIGEGSFRSVWEYGPNTEDYVIKYEFSSGGFYNVKEWQIWKAAEDMPELRKWLAPCIQISSCGSFMLQYRTMPIARLPRRLPDIFRDIKLDNFGSYQGRIVCHDYGHIEALQAGLKDWKLKPLILVDGIGEFFTPKEKPAKPAGLNGKAKKTAPPVQA